MFAAVGTFVILKILGQFMELRVSSSSEDKGLDIDLHGEEAYGEDFAGGFSSFESGSPFAPKKVGG